jgi:hypothetical protein
VFSSVLGGAKSAQLNTALVAKGGRIDVATSRLEPKKLPMTVGDPKHEHKHVYKAMTFSKSFSV